MNDKEFWVEKIRAQYIEETRSDLDQLKALDAKVHRSANIFAYTYGSFSALIMGMQASFNLCDVRDLAAGTIAAVDKGRIGECYILANVTVTLKDMYEMLHAACNAKKIVFYLPLDLADKIAQGLEKQAAKTGKKPLMTTFSVYNLARNNEFDYSKAQRELGYTPRPYQETSTTKSSGSSRKVSSKATPPPLK